MTGWTKSVRALFAALFTTLLALLMHLGAGGGVSIPGTVVVFVLVLWSAMIVAGRRLGYLTLAGLLGLGQVLMHLTMGWSAHTFAHAGPTREPFNPEAVRPELQVPDPLPPRRPSTPMPDTSSQPPAPLTSVLPHPRSNMRATGPPRRG